jgi:hypothetical protein
MLRKFSDLNLGNIELVDKLHGNRWKKHGFSSGDFFDASVNHAKWIAKLGGLGYDYLSF